MQVFNQVRAFVDVILQGRLPERMVVHGTTSQSGLFKIEFVKDTRTRAYKVTAGGRVPLNANGVVIGMNRATYQLGIPRSAARITSMESSNGARVTISRLGVATVVSMPAPPLPARWPVGRARLAPNASLENAILYDPVQHANAHYIEPDVTDGLVRQVYSEATIRRLLQGGGAARSPFTRHRFTSSQVFRLSKKK